LKRHGVVVGRDVREGESLLIRLEVGNCWVPVGRWVLGWQRSTTKSARVRLRLIWNSSVLAQIDSSHLVRTSTASASCVATMIDLHDVEVSWCRMQAALSLRRILCEWRLRCELLLPRPRSGRSDAGRLRLDGGPHGR
jgi:hypothetical protein